MVTGRKKSRSGRKLMQLAKIVGGQEEYRK